MKLKSAAERDARFLHWAIQSVRRQALARHRHETRRPALRKAALARHHRSEKFKRRGRTLANYFRKALITGGKQKAKNRLALGNAMRRIVQKEDGAVIRRIATRLRKRFEKAFGARLDSKVIYEMVGISLVQLKTYFESLFKPGMSWVNYGFRGWHIDHIKPISKFDLLDPRQRQACFHYKNLQPLWMKENLAKHDKIIVGESLSNP